MKSVGARIFWCLYVGAMVAIMAILLVGCSNPHKNMHCVQKHDETYYITVMYGKVPVLTPEHDIVCDKWVPNT